MKPITDSSNVPAIHKPGKMQFVWKHKLVFFLLLVMIVGAGWAAIRYFSMKRTLNREREAIAARFIDETSRVFSWAVRSEMQRDNLEQVNQYLMTLVKEPGFRKIQLIDARNAKVLLSTDKKDEGTTVSDTTILNAGVVRQQNSGDVIRSITPVMGLNSKIGILVIDRVLNEEFTLRKN